MERLAVYRMLFYFPYCAYALLTGFVPIKLSSGEPLVKGQTVTSFTNAEEDAVQLSSIMPFMLETKLKELGANFVGADNWAVNVQVNLEFAPLLKNGLSNTEIILSASFHKIRSTWQNLCLLNA